MNVSELRGALLDHWVAQAEGIEVVIERMAIANPDPEKHITCWRTADGRHPLFDRGRYSPSTNWAQGGRIIDREQISIRHIQVPNGWTVAAALEVRGAEICRDTLNGEPWPAAGFGWYVGATPLQAAMRAFVASKFGDEVPDEVPA